MVQWQAGWGFLRQPSLRWHRLPARPRQPMAQRCKREVGAGQVGGDEPARCGDHPRGHHAAGEEERADDQHRQQFVLGGDFRGNEGPASVPGEWVRKGNRKWRGANAGWAAAVPSAVVMSAPGAGGMTPPVSLSMTARAGFNMGIRCCPSSGRLSDGGRHGKAHPRALSPAAQKLRHRPAR